MKKLGPFNFLAAMIIGIFGISENYLFLRSFRGLRAAKDSSISNRTVRFKVLGTKGTLKRKVHHFIPMPPRKDLVLHPIFGYKFFKFVMTEISSPVVLVRSRA